MYQQTLGFETWNIQRIRSFGGSPTVRHLTHLLPPFTIQFGKRQKTPV